jgi:hypothetical protein
MKNEDLGLITPHEIGLPRDCHSALKRQGKQRMPLADVTFQLLMDQVVSGGAKFC